MCMDGWMDGWMGWWVGGCVGGWVDARPKWKALTAACLVDFDCHSLTLPVAGQAFNSFNQGLRWRCQDFAGFMKQQVRWWFNYLPETARFQPES